MSEISCAEPLVVQLGLLDGSIICLTCGSGCDSLFIFLAETPSMNTRLGEGACGSSLSTIGPGPTTTNSCAALPPIPNKAAPHNFTGNYPLSPLRPARPLALAPTTLARSTNIRVHLLVHSTA